MKYIIIQKICDCNIEHCTCKNWSVQDTNGKEHSKHFSKGNAVFQCSKLNEALKELERII